VDIKSCSLHTFRILPPPCISWLQREPAQTTREPRDREGLTGVKGSSRGETAPYDSKRQGVKEGQTEKGLGESLPTFQRKLKRHLFCQSFPGFCYWHLHLQLTLQWQCHLGHS